MIDQFLVQFKINDISLSCEEFKDLFKELHSGVTLKQIINVVC